MKPIYYPLLIMILASVPAAAKSNDCLDRRSVPAGELTLAQVIELGLCRNPQTSSAFLAAEAARYNKNAGYAGYLPSIDVSGSASKSYRNEEWSGTSYGASLSANYLIFDFGKRLNDLNQLAAVWRATGFDYDQTVQNYVFDVIGAYYALLAANEEVRSAKDMLTVAETAKKTADTKFKAGSVAKADVLKADTTLASRRLDLERADNNRAITKGKILYLLSFSQNQDIVIKDMPADFGRTTENKGIDELIDLAKKKRPDLLAASENTNAARYRRNSAILRRLPSLSASGSISYNNNPADQYNIGTDNYSGQIGLRVSMPLFAGFSHIYNQRASNANYERAVEQERLKNDAAAFDVWGAYQNYKTAQTVLTQTESLLASATESEKSSAGMYRVGRANMLDWQTAQAELASARQQNINAKYDLFVKRAALALAIGDLQEGMITQTNETITETPTVG